MTEAEWAAWTDPITLLDHIRGPTSSLPRPVVATDRQMLLWACACCRRIGHLLNNIHCFNAILTAERFADGELSYKKLTAFGKRVMAWKVNFAESVGAHAARACAHLVEGADSAFDGMATPFLPPAEDATRWTVAAIREYAGVAMAEREKVVQCSIVRDIIGNPFRLVACRTEWRTSTVTALANEIYSDRRFGHLPELASALLQAGCDNAEILNHCRSDEVHVRGCWVVDLLLQRHVVLRWL